MNVNLKLFLTALLMINTCIYVLFLENYYGADTAYVTHIAGSLMTVFFHKKVEKYDNKILKEKEDENTSN